MGGFIVFLFLVLYFAYNVWQMTREISPVPFLEGLKMLFLQGAIDFYRWAKEKLGKK